MTTWRLTLCVALAVFAGTPICACQSLPELKNIPPEPSRTSESQVDIQSVAPVVIDGRPIFVIRTSVAGYSAEERAKRVSSELVRLARNGSFSPDAVRVVPRESWTEIWAGSTRFLVITEADAKAEGMDREALAAQNAEIIRFTIRRYREEHTWSNILRGLANALLGTLAFILAIWVVWRLHYRLVGILERLLRKTAASATASAFWRMIDSYAAGGLLAIGMIIRWLALLVLLDIYLIFVLRQFPQTAQFSSFTTNWLLERLEGMGKSTLDYLPNLVVLFIIGFATIYVVRANTSFFREVQVERIRIKRFDPEWAFPTANLFRLLIIAFAIVVAFPYLPGAESPAFRSVSLFVGLLLSLGSSSAVANAVAGTILNYTRAFRVGDAVQIGDAMGMVAEKTMFVTRLRTPKNVVVSIPNGSVLGGSVTNYSQAAREKSLILHTSVTIGYDTPWRQVEGLLLQAARCTRQVLHKPEPFVLRKQLGDFYITYELNVYADPPDAGSILRAYSELHDNILDAFNEFGVQILSPHYRADRAEKAVVPKSRWYEAPAISDRKTDDASPPT